MRELSFTADFSGVKALGGHIPMPQTPFKAKITEIKVVDHKTEPGALNAEIYLEVVEPAQYAGATRRITTRVPDATEKGQNSRRGWRTLLESVGFAAAKLDAAGVLNIEARYFVGKIGHFFHTPRVEGDPNSYDNVEVLTPDVYAARMRSAPTPPQNGLGNGLGNGPAELPTAKATPAAPPAQSLRNSLLD